MRENDRKKDGGGERREEGIEEILPLVFSQTELVWLLVRVSAAELALFHTGAILSPPGYRPPATAAWEHLGGVKCLFSVCGRNKNVCLCAHSSCFRQRLYNRPPRHPLWFAVCVHDRPISESFRGKPSQVP